MIKALLLDDEPLALRQLEMYSSKVDDMTVVAACTSASAARAWVEQADVLFIDINMPDVNGLDFVRALAHPPLVVFTTAYAQYAVDGFRVRAVDYLLKPFSLADFLQATDRVRHILKVERAAPAVGGVLHFKTDYKTVTVQLEDIRYIESMSEYVKIWLDSQDTPLVVLYSLRRLMEQLPDNRFMRIHRSYIVSLSHIREANVTTVGLDKGPSLPVSDSYRPAFRAWLSSR